MRESEFVPNASANHVLDGSPSTRFEGISSDHPRRAARHYASLGYGVFPCKPNSKEPATRNGFKSGTTSTHRIYEAFRSGHNIGLIAPANVLIIDFDVSKDDRIMLSQRRGDTRQRLAMLEATFSELEQAPLHATPSGGFHSFLRLPEAAPRLSASAWPRGERVTHGELRGMGRAYVVAPPSNTPQGVYRVLRPLVPVDQLPIASSGLIEYLSPQVKITRRARSTSTTTDESFDDRVAAQLAAIRHAPVGNRNNTLNRSAFILGLFVAAEWLSEADAMKELVKAAAAVGLDDREALATVKSGLSSGIEAGEQDARR